MLVQNIRPKLPHDTMFLPSEEGVVFRRAGRTLALKGKGIFQLISTLAPHLSGEATVSTLTTEMTAAKAGVVEKLLATLVDDDMLINHSKEDGEHLTSKEREVFRSQIEFLEHLTAEPCRSFKRFRNANLLITGSGFPLAALACSLIRNGARNLAVDCDASMGEWAPDVFEAAGEMRAKGLECNILEGSLPDRPEHPSETPEDAVCYASDAASINRLIQINRWCRSRQTRLIPGILLGDAFHVGPIVSESNDVCWECALLRYSDQCSAAEARDLWQQAAFDTTSTAHPWPDSSPAMRIFANNLGFQVFRHFTGLAADIRSILSLDIMTLETNTTQIFTHPKCRACAERNRSTGRAVISERQFSREPLEAWNEKLQVIAPLIDKRFGIFHAFDDDHIWRRENGGDSRRYRAFGNRSALYALNTSIRFSIGRGYPLFRTSQVARRMIMPDKSLTTMTPRNVEDFDIWVFEARDLLASIVPIQAPWRAAVENYQLDEPAD